MTAGSGAFVALEGGEGTGKSTQAARLARHLDAVLTREPGGTALGATLRGVLLDHGGAALDDRAELLLMAADRAQHLAEVVAPALAAGRHVVSDRSAWSSLAYQGFGRGLDLEEVRGVCDWAARGRWPDVVVLLDLDGARARQRLLERGGPGGPDRIEAAGEAFHDRVRHGFRVLAAQGGRNWVVVDADAPVDDVAARVAAAVDERLAARPGAGAGGG